MIPVVGNISWHDRIIIEEKEEETNVEDTHEVVNTGWLLKKKMKGTRLWQKLEDQDHSEDSISSSLMEEEEEYHVPSLNKTQI